MRTVVSDNQCPIIMIVRIMHSLNCCFNYLVCLFIQNDCFFDQELISYRYLSCSLTSSKKSMAPSYLIGMKFCRTAPQVKTHRLTESDDRIGFLIERHNFKMAAMTSFHSKSAPAW